MNFNEGERLSSAVETRRKIKTSLEEGIRDWNDSNVASNKKLLNLPSLGILFGAGGLNAVGLDKDSDQGTIVSHFINALCYLNSTRSFTNLVLGNFAQLHRLETSAEFALASYGVNLQEDQLGVFEPEQIFQSETVLLDEKLKATSISMIKLLRAHLETEDEEQLTAESASLLMLECLRDPESNKAWEYKDLQEHLDEILPGSHRLLQLGMENIRFSVGWADEYSHFYEDTRFTKVTETLMTFLKLLG